MSKAALDAITDKVLAHGTSTKQPLKAIAGEPVVLWLSERSRYPPTCWKMRRGY